MLHLKLVLLVVATTLALANGATRARLSHRTEPMIFRDPWEGDRVRSPSSSSSPDFGNHPSSPNNKDFASSHTIRDHFSQIKASQVAAELNVSMAVGMRVLGMTLVAVSLEVPKSLSHLLLNRNESVDFMNKHDMEELFSEKPRTIGTDEYACVNRCNDHKKRPTMRADDSKTNECSEMGQVIECAEQCIQQGGIYASFMHKKLVEMKDLICTNKPEDISKMAQREAMECMHTILNDTMGQFKLFHHAIGCYLKLEEASDNKDTCYVLKSCVIESTIDKLEKVCPNAKIIIGNANTVAVAVLTYLTDGRLVNECPSLYRVSA